MTAQLEREINRRSELNRRLGKTGFLSRKIVIPETELGQNMLTSALYRSNNSVEAALNAMDQEDAEFAAAVQATWGSAKTVSQARSCLPIVTSPTLHNRP